MDLIFFDYTKAFDKVCHELMLGKLIDIGICNQLVSWIAQFLRSRSMFVRVARARSETLPVLSGVPQGSVLGPVLFVIYVNHVVSCLTCKYQIFADDTKIYLAYDALGATNSINSL